MDSRIEIIKGDITKLEVDAIVNAANESLLGGGGVDGAIHAAAGSKLLDECRELGGCKTGMAKITLGYRLPAKYVIHTVGPIWRGGNNEERNFLEDAYLNSLKLTAFYDIKSVAFPAISTGAFGYPVVEATKLALRVVDDYLKTNKTLEKVVLVCFDDDTYDVYRELSQTSF